MSKYRLVKHNSCEQMNWGGNDDTKKCLVVGRIYNAKAEPHKWHTKLIINGKKFNKVCFEEVKQ